MNPQPAHTNPSAENPPPLTIRGLSSRRTRAFGRGSHSVLWQKGQVTATKGGRVRFVPMTQRLAAALRQHRHLRGRREADGEPLTQKIVQMELRNVGGSAAEPSGCSSL